MSNNNINTVVKLLPNIFTTISICAGLTSIRLSIEGNYEMAVIAVLVSCCLDGLDGLLARLLDATSNFGAQLDSLSDAVTFGVAPSIIVYLWLIGITESELSPYTQEWLWVPFLTFAVCNIFRLARFNVSIQKKRNFQNKGTFFYGVPAPAGAYLIFMPLGIDVLSKRFSFLDYQYLFAMPVVLWVLFISYLMISTIPTPSLKSIKINLSKTRRVLILICVCISVSVLLRETCIFLLSLGALYLFCLPLFFMRHRKR